MRFFIKFQYNGTNYHGWQSQPNASSIQQTLTQALSTVLNTPITLMGAGRTDTGVHAKIMYAHFDLSNDSSVGAALAAALNTTTLQTTTHKLNSLLPKDISVTQIIKVDNEAHARFDAKKRTYQYHINTQKDPFLEHQSWYYKQPLDLNLMNQAADILLNHTNFQSFSKVNTDVNTFNCKITQAHWQQENGNLIFTISADRFLRNMVRAIVGTLIKVGLKKITPQDFTAIIQSQDRTQAGFSVPAHGLYLTDIQYDYINP